MVLGLRPHFRCFERGWSEHEYLNNLKSLVSVLLGVSLEWNLLDFILILNLVFKELTYQWTIDFKELCGYLTLIFTLMIDLQR